jgi:hypothetical protein
MDEPTMTRKTRSKASVAGPYARFFPVAAATPAAGCRKRAYAPRAVTVAVLIGTALAMPVMPASAEPHTRTFYNDKGQAIGRAEKRGGTTIYFDDKGQRTGRTERRGDQTIYLNERGQRIGTSKTAR